MLFQWARSKAKRSLKIRFLKIRLQEATKGKVKEWLDVFLPLMKFADYHKERDKEKKRKTFEVYLVIDVILCICKEEGNIFENFLSFFCHLIQLLQKLWRNYGGG